MLGTGLHAGNDAVLLGVFFAQEMGPEGDGREGIVQIVGDPAGQGADAFHPLPAQNSLFGVFPLRDVFGQSRVAANAALVIFDGKGAIPDPVQLAVDMDNAVFDVRRLQRAMGNGLPDALAVLGMDRVQPGLARLQERRGGPAEQHRKGGGDVDKIAGGRVDDVEDFLDVFRELAEAAFGFPEGRGARIDQFFQMCPQSLLGGLGAAPFVLFEREHQGTRERLGEFHLVHRPGGLGGRAGEHQPADRPAVEFEQRAQQASGRGGREG